MRFLFIPGGNIPVHASILNERPLGGTETGIVLLAEVLTKLGHEVRVITDYENPPLSNPLYLPRRALASTRETDVLIAIRQWQSGFTNIKARLNLFWTGDAYDQPHTFGIGDKRIASHFDALLMVSNWQADTLSSASGFPKKKCWVIKNGINPDLFVAPSSTERDRYRMVYSSTPYRGLDHLLRLFPKIQEKVPQATLHIFSDYDVYKGSDGKPPVGYEVNIARHEQLKKSVSAVPGIVFRGNVKQAELAKEMLLASFLSYPNIFMETSCISAIEAMAAGCVVISSKLGALPETVGPSGILISGQPGEKEYDKSFIDAHVQLMSDHQKWENLSQKARAHGLSQSWESVAKRLLAFINDTKK